MWLERPAGDAAEALMLFSYSTVGVKWSTCAECPASARLGLGNKVSQPTIPTANSSMCLTHKTMEHVFRFEM